MYLNSGMSCTIRKSDTKELIGCTFFTTWKRDDDYEVVEDASLASWHNTAAEIAMDECPECPQVRWLINLFSIQMERITNRPLSNNEQ